MSSAVETVGYSEAVSTFSVLQEFYLLRENAVLIDIHVEVS